MGWENDMYMSKKACQTLRQLKLHAIAAAVEGLTLDDMELLDRGEWVYASTEAGTMRITIISDMQTSPRRWVSGFVACQFADPDHARQHIDCGPSGKWNFHQDSAVGVLSMQTSLRALNPRRLEDGAP